MDAIIRSQQLEINKLNQKNKDYEKIMEENAKLFQQERSKR